MSQDPPRDDAPAAYPPAELRLPSPLTDRNPDSPFGIGLRDAIASGWYNNATDELFEGVPIGPADTVLDMGCGEGGNASFCARRGPAMILIDVNEQIVSRACDRLDGLGARSVRGIASLSTPLPLADGCATRLLCTEVLEHVDDPGAVMAELARLGSPGALYVLTVPHPLQEQVQRALAPAAYFQAPNHVRVIEPAEFEALVVQAGLVIERRASVGFFWSVYFSLYWNTGWHQGTTDHPVLNHWTAAWTALLATPGGDAVQRALNQAMPKSQVIIARKP